MAVSAKRTLGENPNPEVRESFLQNGSTPLSYIMIHPAMRQIDIQHGSWSDGAGSILDSIGSGKNVIEDNERDQDAAAGRPSRTAYTHTMPESPLRNELGLLATVDPDKARTLMFYSGFDKAGLAFLYGQSDDPNSPAYDVDLPTAMLGRKGLFGSQGQRIGRTGEQRTGYVSMPNRANIWSAWIGINDQTQAGQTVPHPSLPTGDIKQMDMWHVDLWGWSLPGVPFRSRHLFEKNQAHPITSWHPTWDETGFLADGASSVSGPLSGGLAAQSATDVEVMPSLQIVLHDPVYKRAWKRPADLIRDGQVGN